MDKRWRRCNLLSPMLPTYSCIRTFPCKMPWCLLKLKRNFPREYHTIIPVHLRIKIWSNGECALFVANTFCPLKWKLFTGLVAESLKHRVILKTQQSMCNHCELLPVGKGSCYMWWHFKRWVEPWLMKVMWKILISWILLVMKVKVNSVLHFLILIKSSQSGLMKLRTACIVILVKYQS